MSPTDGIVSQIGMIDGSCIIQAKGIDYTLVDLFDGDDDLASRFDNGGFVTIYLAPRNYHRVHLPLAGRARFCVMSPGLYFPSMTSRREKFAACFAEMNASRLSTIRPAVILL